MSACDVFSVFVETLSALDEADVISSSLSSLSSSDPFSLLNSRLKTFFHPPDLFHSLCDYFRSVLFIILLFRFFVILTFYFVVVTSFVRALLSAFECTLNP